MTQDVHAIFKHLEMQAVGIDPNTNKMQEGYFSAFRPHRSTDSFGRLFQSLLASRWKS